MDQNSTRNHIISLLFIVICSTGYLFDVLFFDKHLSAFDFALQKPSWTVEFGDVKAHNAMLSDSPTAHYPYKREFWEAAKRGYNPHYLPHIFSGKPTSGQGVGIFSTSLFQLVLDIPNAMDFSTWFRLILAAALMYLFLFQLGLGSAVASLGAVAWAYNMHQIAWLLFPQHLATQLWLPLLLCLNLLVLKQRQNLIAAMGLVLTVVFFYTSSYTQIVLYSFIFLGVFNTLFVLIVQRGSFADKMKSWICIHAVYLVAGMILLPDALWQAQEIKEGLRGSQDFRYNEFKLDVSFAALLRLLGDLLPSGIDVIRFLMPNYQSELGQIPAIKNILKSNEVEFQVYFGLVCLYFTVYGVIRSIIEKNRVAVVFCIMLMLCMALFNGNPTIISLLNTIPFAGSGSYARIITLLLLTAIILAGYGARYMLEDLGNRRYAYLFVPLLAIVLWLFAGKLAYPDILALREFVPWMAYLSVFILFSAALARIGKADLVVPIAVLLTFIELTVTGYGFNTRLDGQDHFPENTVIKKLRAAEGNFRTALLMSHTGYHHNILTYYDLSTIGGYETTVPNDYVYFMRKAYQKLHLTLNGILFLFDGNIEILRLLNAHYIISNLELDSDQISPVYQNDQETLYMFNDPLDRAYCASDQIVNPDRENIPAQLAKLAKTMDRPVVVTSPIVEYGSLTGQCRVSNLEVFTSKIRFTVESDRPTLVFVPTNYHQYWRARLNSEKVPIHRANYAFMAVRVDAGKSRVVLEFINTKLTISAVILLLLGLASLYMSIFRVTKGWQRCVFIACGLLLIVKSMMSIPGIMNTDIPEKPSVHSGD